MASGCKTPSQLDTATATANHSLCLCMSIHYNEWNKRCSSWNYATFNVPYWTSWNKSFKSNGQPHVTCFKPNRTSGCLYFYNKFKENKYLVWSWIWKVAPFRASVKHIVSTHTHTSENLWEGEREGDAFTAHLLLESLALKSAAAAEASAASFFPSSSVSIHLGN